MKIDFNLAHPHQVVAANAHYYEKPTEPLYIDRTLQFHDLIYLVEGEWAITENDTNYFLAKDDVLLLKAGAHHYTRLPCSPNTRTMCIHISCEEGDGTQRPGNLFLPSHIQTHGRQNCKHYFSEIISTFWSDREFKSNRLSALFSMLVLDLLEISSSLKPLTLAEQIIQRIDSHPYRQFRLQEIADYFLVSTKTVENAIQQATGKTFSRYQTERKLEMIAVQIEVEPEIKLSELATVFGFCDEFHLSKVFKKKYGMSPSAYKKGRNG